MKFGRTNNNAHNDRRTLNTVRLKRVILKAKNAYFRFLNAGVFSDPAMGVLQILADFPDWRSRCRCWFELFLKLVSMKGLFMFFCYVEE